MLLIVYTLLIIYARVGLTPLYSMLFLFVECWESKLLIQMRVEKLNGDLYQPSGIGYVLRSFSVRYFVSLAYRKELIFEFKLSIVVPQAIEISLCNIIVTPSKFWIGSLVVGFDYCIHYDVLSLLACINEVLL